MCECGVFAELTNTPYGLLCDACRAREEGYHSKHQPLTTLSTEELLSVQQAGYDEQRRIEISKGAPLLIDEQVAEIDAIALGGRAKTW